MWKPLAAGALAAVALAAPARADTRIRYVDAAGAPASQVYVKAGKVRLEPAGGGPVVLFDAADGSLTTLDVDRRAYTVIDPATMDRVGQKARAAQVERAARSGQLTAAQKRVMDEMARMTPQQRALLEEMMGGLPGLGPAPKITIKDLGTTRKIAGYPCADVHVLAADMTVAHMCVAELAVLAIPPLDRAALQALHDGVQRMMKIMGPGAPAVPDLVPRGLALLYEPGSPEVPRAREGEILHAISGDPLADALFQVPADFTAQPFPDPE